MKKINFTYKRVKTAEVHFDESLRIKQIDNSAVDVCGCCKECINFFMQGMLKVLPTIKKERLNDTTGRIFFPGTIVVSGRTIEFWEEEYEFKWTEVES